MIKCKTTIGKNEYGIVANVFTSLKKNRRVINVCRTILFCMAGFYFFIGLCCFFAEGMTPDTVSWFWVGLIPFIPGVFMKQFMKVLFKIRFGRLQKSVAQHMQINFDDVGTREYVFSEDGVDIKSVLGKSHYDWNSFMLYDDIKHYTYLVIANNNFVLIDKNTMSDGEVKELYDLLKQKITIK